MKKTLLLVGIIILAIGILYSISKRADNPNFLDLPETAPGSQKAPNSVSTEDSPVTTVIAQGLDTPWAIAFLPASPSGGPDGSMLVTERKGTVRLIKDGQLQEKPVATIGVHEIGEGGLLGITIHPDFSTNGYVYLYFTQSLSGNVTLNQVMRMTYQNNQLTNGQVIIDNIPGASNHDGGRLKFGPDGFLYITTGDAQVSSRAQDVNSLAGKILRVTDDGSPAPGNPFDFAQGKSFGDPRIYSFGHRNVQGIAWDKDGGLFATEHGRSGLLSGLDEINYVQIGRNYGWPDIQGDETRPGMETSIKNSGATTTWAPSGMAYLNGSLFFGGLRGQALYEAVLSGNTVTGVKEHFKGQFGRLREVVLGPDGMLYITTSNRDGRGNPITEDDRIIKVNPNKL